MRIYLAGQKAFGAAVYRALTDAGHTIAGVSAPPWASRGRQHGRDRLRAIAEDNHTPWLPSGKLNADNVPDGLDLIVAAHSHDFIGNRTLAATNLGGIGYHPSLLPRHRGRDAIRWTLKMGDPITGGSVYWLTNRMDGGPIAGQDWCFVRPDDTPDTLWRRDLFPMGVRLLTGVVNDLARNRHVAVPQDEQVATWEPSWERPPAYRPDLIALPARAGQGPTYIRDHHAARHTGAA